MKGTPWSVLRLAVEVLRLRETHLWSRAVPVLARQALELGLEDFWRRQGTPDLARTSMRCQLICLREYLRDAEAAAAASHVWGALSRAMHHQAYAASPTWSEVGRWLGQVTKVLNSLNPDREPAG